MRITAASIVGVILESLLYGMDPSSISWFQESTYSYDWANRNVHPFTSDLGLRSMAEAAKGASR